MTNQRDDLLTMALEAKAARDEMGMTDDRADAQLARMQAGDFSGLTSPEAVKGGRVVDGPQGAKPAMVARVEDGIMVAPRPGPGGDGSMNHRPPRSATEPQLRFITVLLDKMKHHNNEVWRVADPWFRDKCQMNALTFDLASTTITRLKARLDEPSVAPQVPVSFAPSMNKITAKELHPGRYAVIGEDGTVDFYHLKESKKGNLYALLQTGDNETFVNWDVANAVFRKILADPKEAMIRYGREIGKCGHCGRTLTNEESRQAGIGPICRKGMAAAYPGMDW
jgi:hypothetical protein